jgi:glycosyltransferase involved in cell wall biosynthesis
MWRYTGLLARAARHVDQFLAPSRFTMRMHAARGFTNPMTYLPNFIDCADHEWQRPAPRPHERPYFFFAGRLETIKGLQTLIDLWPRAQNYDLLVAGTGTNEFDLRARAAGNRRIRFLGGLPPSEMGGFYYHAIACLVPSLTYETFGLTSIEAFARKTPAIVRDLGALPEVVQDSGGGFVYRTDDELLDAMNRLAASPALRGELAEKGYDGFRRWWSRDAHLAQYSDLLNRLAEGKRGSPPGL